MAYKKLSLLALLALLPPVFAVTSQFQHWYPEYKTLFEKKMREDCNEQYENYLAGRRNWTQSERERWEGLVNTNKPAFPPANCLLENTSEWMKSHMASAAVLLGLMPQTIASIGPSAEEISSLFVIARRPLLGILLAAGAPCLHSYRDIDFGKVVEDLKNKNSHDHIRLPHLSTPGHYIVLGLEFLVAAGAVANILENSYRLGIQTICVIGPHVWYLPILWVVLGVPASLYSSHILWSGLKRKDSHNCFRAQYTPTAERRSFGIGKFKKTHLSVIESGILSMYIAFHAIASTLIFSSLIFITVLDALGVVARYIASVLVCRAILKYELTQLRDKHIEFQAVSTTDDDGGVETDAQEKTMMIVPSAA